MTNHAEPISEDFGEYRELTGDDHESMIELIRLYMRHGVPEGMVFKPCYLALRDNPECLEIILKRFKYEKYSYHQSVFVFGWWPRLLVDARTIASPITNIWHGSLVSNWASIVFSEPEGLREITKKESIELSRNLETEEIRRDEDVSDILETLSNPRHWSNPPPLSTVFLIGPVQKGAAL